LRLLVRCAACHRQYDASRRAIGTRFRCRCGAAVEVPKVEAREAAVVSCRSCGATRQAGATACAYCGSDFTIQEQDLDTICPACFARISDSARFCHHCATPIQPEEDAGEATDRACPVCGEAHPLRSRALGATTALECTRCAGLWLGEEAFRSLSDKARAEAQPFPDPRTIRDTMTKARKPIAKQAGPLYRPCPVCAVRMSRTNFGRQSGVLLDRCPGHGTWFDAHELDAALAWVKLGGEQKSAEEKARHERERASFDKIRVQPKIPEEAGRAVHNSGEAEGEWLMALFRALGARVK
jgi:Zn-finger nucleic acid-binding protein/ribosomal protein L40E